jgi:hypothetical protein
MVGGEVLRGVYPDRSEKTSVRSKNVITSSFDEVSFSAFGSMFSCFDTGDVVGIVR